MQQLLAKWKIVWEHRTIPLMIGGILVVGFLAYVNIYSNEFLWDDEFLIQRNALVQERGAFTKIFQSGSGAGAGRLDDLYRPLQLVAYNGIVSVFGVTSWPFHAFNVVLHLANAVLVFFLILLLFDKLLVAFWTALLWVVHPIHTEAITYISGTADPLYLLFGLGAMVAYVCFRKYHRWWCYGLALVLFVLSLLSKEIAIVLPILLYLYEFVFHDDEKTWKPYLWPTPLFLLALVYFGFRLTVLNFEGALGLVEAETVYGQSLLVRLFTFLAALLSYYSFLLFPVNLHFERQFPVFTSLFAWPVFTSLGILIALVWTTFAAVVRRNYYVSFGILWFFIALIPVSGIIPVNALILEHWLYLPSIGFFLIVAMLLFKIHERIGYYRSVVSLAVVVLLFILLSLTLARNIDWRDPITFYNNILSYGPSTARVHNNLAMAYDDHGNTISAERHYQAAIQMSDRYAETRYNLGLLYARSGQFDAAIEQLEHSIEINPNFFFAHRLLGQIYQQLRKEELAEQYFRQAEAIELY